MEEHNPIHNEEEAKTPNNEQSLNIPSSNELVVPNEATIESEPQPATINPVRPGHLGGLQPATDMEVHHHAHDPATPHHKKNWKSYFWEFLMLFLAVFCGFLAENQREHYIEQQREKKFAILLLNDLIKDSVHFSYLVNDVGPRMNKRAKNLNELLLRKPAATDKEVILALGEIKRVGLLLTNTTFSQMKTSGTLRYIRNDSLTELLSKYYDVLCARVIHSWEESRDFHNDYLLPFRLKHVKSLGIIGQSDSLRKQDFVMMDRTSRTDQELMNYVINYHDQLTGSLINNKCEPAMDVIRLLIPMLKKEYHLK